MNTLKTGYFATIQVRAPGLTYTKDYQVLALSKPELTFVGENGENPAVSLNKLKQGTRLMLNSPESSPLQISYEVVSYDVEFTQGSRLLSDNQKNNGDKLSTSEINIRDNMKRGDRIAFYNVKYKVRGSSNTLNYPGGLTLKGR